MIEPINESVQLRIDQLHYAAQKMNARGRAARSRASQKRYDVAASNLRLVATLVREGSTSLEVADDWIDAADSVLGQVRA